MVKIFSTKRHMKIHKKFIGALVLNILLVTFINIGAFFYSNINLLPFTYILVGMILVSITCILLDTCYYICSELYKGNKGLIVLLCILLGYCLLKFTILEDYFFFRYANSYHFDRYFQYSFHEIILLVSEDFRNYNGMVIMNLLKDLLTQSWNTIHYIYVFFQLLGIIYLYRVFCIFSKNTFLTICLVLLYFSIETFFIITQTITYVNIIIPSFIIFIFYLFNLDKKRNISSYILYFLAYIFLITGRPDFFFIAIIIEFLNAYLRNSNIISTFQNILFYMLLVPYYFIVNRYLLNRVYEDRGLIGEPYITDNFWYIFIDRTLGIEMIERAIRDISFLMSDTIFLLVFLCTNIIILYLYLTKNIKNKFYIFFLLIYTILYFCIVIFIHEEGFTYSEFKYFSLVYLIYYIVLCLCILKMDTILDVQKKYILYMIVGLFLIYNFSNSYSEYRTLRTNIISDTRTGTGEITNIYNTDDMYGRIYHSLFNENRPIVVEKYINHTNFHPQYHSY